LFAALDEQILLPVLAGVRLDRDVILGPFAIERRVGDDLRAVARDVATEKFGVEVDLD
jgi:hypothetical protein